MNNSMTFNHTRKPWLYLIKGRRKSPFAPLRRNLVYVRGRPGALLESTDVDVLPIEQPIGFKVQDVEHELQIIDELKRWLITKDPVPLEFDDEPGRTYFAVIQNSIEDFEKMVSLRQGTLQFLCPDPYSYGEEKHAVISSDASIVHNDGIEEADPIFELEVVQHSTFALIQNQDEEYQMVGEPPNVETQPFVKEQLILHSTMSTTNGWTAGNQVDNGSVEGTMISNGSRFLVQSFGNDSEAKWHGPALKTSLSQTLQDFRLDALIQNINGVEEVGKVEIYLLDVNSVIIGRITLKDAWQDFRRNRGEAKAGGTGGHYLLDQNYEGAWNNFKGMLRLERIGNQWLSYIAQIKPDGTHHARETRRYTDTANRYMDRVAQIQVHISKFGGFKHGQMSIDDLKVWKINQPQNHLQQPYLLYPGDILTFDHANDDILLNGEDRTDLKHFGASYFKLKPGQNTIIVQPSDTFTPRLRYRERF